MRRRANAVPAGSKRPLSELYGEGPCEKPGKEERVKKARAVQKAAEESLEVARLQHDSRVSYTQRMSSSFKQQVADLLPKVDLSKHKSLQARAIASTHIPLLLRINFYSLLRKATANEKRCVNSLEKSSHCIATQLGSLGPLVATVGIDPVKLRDNKVGPCIACRVARAQQAALGNMLCGQLNQVKPSELTCFEDAVCVQVSPAGSDNEVDFKIGTTWNAPYVFNEQTKTGSHFGTVNHTPLLLDNLTVSADKTRYIPLGFECVDGVLQRQPDRSVCTLTQGFF